MSTLKYWVWFSDVSGVRTKTKKLLMEHFSDPQAIYFANEGEYKALEEISDSEIQALGNKDLTRAENILTSCADIGAEILTLNDARYPARLKNIYDPPAVLYVLGKLPWLDEEVPIAIVGTRRATPYGIKMGKRFGYEITKGGGLIVSGLAEGVDTAGAQGALRAGGSCIGVLGTAIDVVYPKSNKTLFEDIKAVGALISEFPPGAKTKASNFPQRNRIMSGLSLGVVVIEAPKSSGSLITASRAADQGRDVFVVPGNADAPNCVGSNELIRDGAKIVMRGDDVLAEYEGLYPSRIKRLSSNQVQIPQEDAKLEASETAAPQPEPEADLPEEKEKKPRRFELPSLRRQKKPTLESQLAELTPEQLKVISSIGTEGAHLDDIIERCGAPSPQVMADLTVLQIKGFITQEKGKRFTLNVISRK
jgi:DNA processing protein